MAKDSLFSGVNRYLKETKSEAKKVIWPTGKQLMKNTLVVIVMIIVFGVFIWGTDFLMGFINSKILG